MSKISHKQRYQQLKEWLVSMNTTTTNTRKPKRKFSKSDLYNQRKKK